MNLHVIDLCTRLPNKVSALSATLSHCLISCPTQFIFRISLSFTIFCFTVFDRGIPLDWTATKISPSLKRPFAPSVSSKCHGISFILLLLAAARRGATLLRGLVDIDLRSRVDRRCWFIYLSLDADACRAKRICLERPGSWLWGNRRIHGRSHLASSTWLPLN